MFNTPILLLIFNRPEETKTVLATIRQIKPRQLFIAADAPRLGNQKDKILCEQTKQLLDSIDWTCAIKTLFRTDNLGCGKAVSEAITWFFEHVEQGIILEDDCLPHLSFFNYCETLLDKYKNDPSVYHIGGNNFQFGQLRGDGSYYFSKYCHVWGWATWRRAWNGYDIKMTDYPTIKSSLNIEQYWRDIFDAMYQYPMDTWDYQWFFHVLKHKGKAIIPNKNLVLNIGFRNDATHTTSLPSWINKHTVNHEGLPILIHPKHTNCNKIADKYTFKTHYQQGFNFKKTVKNVLNSLIKNALKLPYFFYKSKAIALIRTDNIGDYILFRNLLSVIKQSDKYKNKKIILIGNIVWKELADHFDNDSIDTFFWIDMSRFKQDKIYRLKTLWQLNQLGINELINTVHSRTWEINDIIAFSGAKTKTTCASDAVNLGGLLTIKSDKLFNNIVPSLSNSNFEFFRNKTFIEHLLNQKIELNKPYFKGIKKDIEPLQIIIFPSAQSAQRRWNTSHFATLVQLIAKNFPQFEFVILGSKEDINLGESILKMCPNTLVIKNLCGKTSLIELVEIIANSRLLISNETSAVHIAAAVETPTVCISNGERFKRFSPYPFSMTTLLTYFFPHNDFYKKENTDYLTHKYQYTSDLDINQIEPDIVLPTVRSILMHDKNN